MHSRLSTDYFSRFFRGALEGHLTCVRGSIKLPLTVFYRDQIFQLDSDKTIEDFFSPFQALTQGSQTWRMDTEILEFNEEGENMECYFVEVQLHGDESFRNANMSAKLYVRRADDASSVELIEFF